MTSSPDTRPPREGALLRGALAAQAGSYRDAGPSPQDRRGGGRRRRGPPGAPRRPRDRRPTTRGPPAQPVPPADMPEAPVAGRPTFRLGDVYAEELQRLR